MFIAVNYVYLIEIITYLSDPLYCNHSASSTFTYNEVLRIHTLGAVNLLCIFIHKPLNLVIDISFYDYILDLYLQIK